MRHILAALVTAGLALTAVPARAEPDKLRVGLVSRTFYYVPIWAAVQQGFYRDEGLDIDLTVMTNTTAQAAALKDGALQITVAPTEGIIDSVQNGGSLRIVAGNSGKLSHFVIAQSRFHSIEDLRGATIGILSMTEGSRFHFQQVAAAHGMTEADYKLKETGGAPARNQALLDRTIDAGLQSIPWSYVAEDAGFVNLADVSAAIPDWQFTTYNVDAIWAKQHSDLVVRFLRATLRGTQWMYSDKAGAVALASRELGIKSEYAERGWEYFTRTRNITPDLSVNRPGLVKVIEVLKAAGQLPPGTSADPGRYIDGDYLAQAIATARR